MRTVLLLILSLVLPAAASAEAPFIAPATNPLRSGGVSSGPAGLPTTRAPSLVREYPTKQTTFQPTAAAKPLLQELDPSSTEEAGELNNTTTRDAKETQPSGSYAQRSEAAKLAGLAMADDPKPAPEKPNEPVVSSGRKLGAAAPQPSSGKLDFGENPFQQALEWRPQAETITTVGSGLALVLGLLLMTTWAIKKSLPRSARVLPEEIAEVLGRVNLGRKQTVQLLKIGRKLVLVSSTPEGETKTLTEIDREEDVLHLLQLCQENSGRGSSAAFDEIFSDLTTQRAPEGFLGDEADRFDPQRLAAAYANTPGGQGRG